MIQFDMKKKVAVITGATGGIGKAVVKALHSEGAIVIATDLNKNLLDKLVIELGQERLLTMQMDVTDKAELEAVRTEVISKYGRVDFVFANAGIACDPPQTVATMSNDLFEKVIEVDLFGVTRTVKTFLSDIQNSQGHILLTASIYAFINGYLNTPYAISKAGVEMYGRALRAELAGTGASVGVLYPGWVNTNIAKSAFGGNKEATFLAKRYYRGIFGEAVEPELIAKAVSMGIRKRKARIISPVRWVVVSWFRGVINVFTDWLIDRDKTAHSVLKATETNSSSQENT